MFTKISGPKKDEENEQVRILLNKELHYLDRLPRPDNEIKESVPGV